MERQEVVEFIQKEAKRLREEQHIDDLIKASRLEELSMVECHAIKAVTDFCSYNLKLEDEEIPEGDCAAVIIWCGSCADNYNYDLFEDEEHIAHRVAREAWGFGKNVAVQMLAKRCLFDISSEDFFSEKYAEEYDEKYGIEKD